MPWQLHLGMLTGCCSLSLVCCCVALPLWLCWWWLSQEELDKYDIPYVLRDYCAHKYIPFIVCRYKKGASPPSLCAHEKHDYVKCEYREFKRRVAIAVEERKQRGLL